MAYAPVVVPLAGQRAQAGQDVPREDVDPVRKLGCGAGWAEQHGFGARVNVLRKPADDLLRSTGGHVAVGKWCKVLPVDLGEGVQRGGPSDGGILSTDSQA